MVQTNNAEIARRGVWSGMPLETYHTHRLDKFLPLKGNDKAYAAALKYVAHDDEKGWHREHHFLTLGGAPGRGKSHLALGIGWHWIDNAMGLVKFWYVTGFLDEMRDWYQLKQHATPGEPIPTSPLDWAKRADLVILDDLGAQRDTEWAVERLDELVEYRYVREKCTVITTNLNLEQIPPRIASRISGGVKVLLEGPDMRAFLAKQRKG